LAVRKVRVYPNLGYNAHFLGDQKTKTLDAGLTDTIKESVDDWVELIED